MADTFDMVLDGEFPIHFTHTSSPHRTRDEPTRLKLSFSIGNALGALPLVGERLRRVNELAPKPFSSLEANLITPLAVPKWPARNYFLFQQVICMSVHTPIHVCLPTQAVF